MSGEQQRQEEPSLQGEEIHRYERSAIMEGVEYRRTVLLLRAHEEVQMRNALNFEMSEQEEKPVGEPF